MPRGLFTDHSGEIDTGSTAQEVMDANSSRAYLLFENVSDTDMWIDFGTDAVADQPSIKIAPDGSYELAEPGFVSTQALSVLCASAGKKFVCKEG